MRKISITLSSFLVFALMFHLFSQPIFAHAVVKPSEAKVSSWTTFTLGVPVEQDSATTNVRLVIPEGLKHVTPNVKPGWQLEIKKEGTGESTIIKELIWSQGRIPVGQRDEFVFSAQVPSNTQDLPWKVFQTYANGNVVAWDKDPKSEMTTEGGNSGPYSVTRVIDDINNSQVVNNKTNNSAGLISIVALLVSGAALALQFSRK